VRISQSILGQADKCMLSAQHTIDRPSWAVRTGSVARAMGTAFHAGLEDYYLCRKGTQDSADPYGSAEETLEKCITVDLYDNTPVERFLWSDKYPDFKTAHAAVAKMLDAYLMDAIWPVEFNTLEVEHKFSFQINDKLQMTGSIDLVLESRGWVVLVDHKTAGKAWPAGKHLPRKQNQAPWYTAAARKIWPDAAGVMFAFDVMTYDGKFTRLMSNPEPRHEQAILEKAASFVELYQKVHVEAGIDLPANPSSNLCNPKWCDFFDGCAYGAALE
jgi:hypothetical protein